MLSIGVRSGAPAVFVAQPSPPPAPELSVFSHLSIEFILSSDRVSYLQEVFKIQIGIHLSESLVLVSHGRQVFMRQDKQQKKM